MTHAPEPWAVKMNEWIIPVEHLNRPIGCASDAITDRDEYAAVIARIRPDTRHERFDYSANARRIVACVNACVGIPTEALEAGVVKEMTKLADSIADPAKYRYSVVDAARAILAKLRRAL